jgi:hypothetical protein
MRRRLVDSLLGGVLPAIVGVVATLMLTSMAAETPRVALLLVWTVLGFLSLTDFGLTRAASKLRSTLDLPQTAIIARLWRAAIPFGLIGAVVLSISALLPGNTGFAWALLPVPLIAAMQFPLVGVLEATGRFGYLAVHRVLNASFAYLVPAVVIVVFPDAVLGAALFITLSRLALFLAMCHRTRVPVVATLRQAASPATTGLRTGQLVGWLAVSSMLGPALLYADRLMLAGVDGTGGQWVFYVALSEIAMKTYIIPTALVAVLFPWLSMHAARLTGRRRRALRTWFPLASFPSALAIATAIAVFVPDPVLQLLSVDTEWAMTARVIILLSVGATLLNWSSQIQIAVLHALEAHQFVGTFQLISAVPFLAALALATHLGGIIATAAVVFARVALTWLALVARSRRALPRTSDA